MNEIKRHPLNLTFRKRGSANFAKKHSERKIGYKSCSMFPLILGIYYSRAFELDNHFNKDLIEAFKALKCF